MSFGTVISNLAIRTSRFVVSHAPEILMGVGTVGVVAGTVIISKQTLKIDEVLADEKAKKEEIQAALERGVEGYDEKDAKQDMMVIRKSAAWKMTKLYAPGVAIFIGGIACYFGAFGILKARNGVLAMSLAAANEAFDAYRQRVIEDQGEDKDKEYLYGLKKEKITEVDPETGKKETKEVLMPTGEGSISRYAIRFTPEFSTEAGNDVNYNTAMLRSIEHSFNAMLPGRKKIFLDEVYKELGVDITYESRQVGWDYNADKFGDGKIMFIITEIVEKDVNSPTGYHKELIVDFNVDGNVAAKLPVGAAALGMEIEDHITAADRLTTF